MIGFFVALGHCENPDIVGGYWQLPKDKADRSRILVNSLKTAQSCVRFYIERNELGAGNWNAGELTLDGVLIGRISYNGRAWHLDGREMFANDPILKMYASKRK